MTERWAAAARGWRNFSSNAIWKLGENFSSSPLHILTQNSQNCMISMWKILHSCPIALLLTLALPFVPCLPSAGCSLWMDFHRTFHLILWSSSFRQMKQVHRSILNSITGSWWDSGMFQRKAFSQFFQLFSSCLVQLAHKLSISHTDESAGVKNELFLAPNLNRHQS